MKCPKCGYLGFETGDRCRNCGYDFSLAPAGRQSGELPLRGAELEAPLADFDLEGLATTQEAEPSGGLDLDRLIGEPDADETVATPERVEPAGDDRPWPARPPAPPRSEPPPPVRRSTSRPAPRRTPAPSRTGETERLESGSRAEPAPAEPAPAEPATARPVEHEPRLPFSLAGDGQDDTPLITSPRPLRPPLAVRRATPEVVRARPRTTRSVRRQEPALALEPDPADPAPDPALAGRAGDWARVFEPASRQARLLAALIDIVVLGGIGWAVLYLTLRLLGLTMADAGALPLVPLSAFLLLLDGGYVAAFTVAGGQTIGKMATGIRVIGDDGRAVDAAGGVLRAVGCGLSLATFGLGYLPALLSADGRALQDRLAGTRVINDRP